MNEEYAIKIAREWNLPRSGIGYVTRFQVRRAFLDRYEIRQVGGRTILEYWIPAGELEPSNNNSVGRIEVVAEYRQERPRGITCRRPGPGVAAAPTSTC